MIDLKDVEGWVVTGHHNDVLTYVGPDEPQDQSEIRVGLFGRSKRHRDGTGNFTSSTLKTSETQRTQR